MGCRKMKGSIKMPESWGLLSFEGVTKGIKDKRQLMGKEKRCSKWVGKNTGYKKISR